MTALTYPGHTYDQIIIGAGSAAAMYLNTLRSYHQTASAAETMPAAILVIGMDDPWAGARGYEKDRYIENINQARQLFEHGTGAKASMDLDPVDRKEWAGANRGIIDEVTSGHYLNAEVKMVTRETPAQPAVESGPMFLVETTGGGIFRAGKVVIAAGAGIETSDREYHMVPKEVADYRKNVNPANPNVMDLDQFQNGAPVSVGKKLAVIGENAGTDAIMEAATRGYDIKDVFWFMSARTNPGTALTWDISRLNPSFTAEEAGQNKMPNGGGGCVVRTASVKLEAGTGQKIKVMHGPGNRVPVEVDYFVYAKGQRGGGVTRASRDAETQKMKNVPFVHASLAANLEPVYDVNQRFSSMGSGGGAWEHVVGIQLEGSTATHGITLVGSAAVQVGRSVTHNYLDAEYAQMIAKLADVTAAFSNCARDRFPELYRFNKFKDMMSDLKVTELKKAAFETKRDQYVSRLVATAETSARGLVGGSSSEIIARVKTRVNLYRSLARELCYLFWLRVQAAQYYDKLKKTPGARAPERPDQLQSAGLKRTLPETVSDGRLLGGMQRNIAAGNQSHNIDHIRTLKGNNFLEDQQSIALYIAVHYPNMKEADANGLVELILKDRLDKGRGFTPTEMGVWDFKLGQADREGRASRNFAYETYF